MKIISKAIKFYIGNPVKGTKEDNEAEVKQ